MKISELEAQYAIIVGLALWAEEPPEVHFFKKSWCSQKVFVQKCQKLSKFIWVQDGDDGLGFGLYG